MSTDRQYRKVVFICDGCGEALETRVGDFKKALDVLHDNRWEDRPAKGRGNGYQHFCPECS